ncbi:hypothetical protein C0Q70_11389 [Pomacea canaliculata]|uniref:Galectin n=1 Tax=Pomacea canaliculata TaxID=400727 RepID=A0A2T7P5U4_POMCA|nr:uncharacterized protein LOC112567263 [Pomacea canaliculata]PVD28794.1 hypothetical protein C0Q70_11389 [Pomacea canaliculata]
MALTVPYSYELPFPLDVDMKIGVNAAFKEDGHRFTLMLLCDENYEMADALLIVETESSSTLKFSYRRDGVTGDVETIPVDDWQTHKALQLYIRMERDYFMITLNGKFTKTYPYNFSMKKVKDIWIDGDITLYNFTPPQQ